ncbi:MAG: hypothetical protein RIG63_29130 [Coleofasciculus chthonoplastes F3-SA18-01]|jgi:FtsZ-interacting cell division protein ZipA|uniref:hypothetical protein n=1 Tax=Coleofasciculus chthonoplastes TaxID=64178 RepID=UPI0032F42CC2
MFGFLKSKDKSSEAPKTKKSKDYFLELDDTGAVKSEPEAKKPEPAQATQAPEAEAKKPAAKKPAAKATKAAKAPKAKPQKAAPQATPAAASNGKAEPQPGVTFAPNNLLPLKTNAGRRRPGPSMNNFLEMARQVQPPRS